MTLTEQKLEYYLNDLVALRHTFNNEEYKHQVKVILEQDMKSRSN